MHLQKVVSCLINFYFKQFIGPARVLGPWRIAIVVLKYIVSVLTMGARRNRGGHHDVFA